MTGTATATAEPTSKGLSGLFGRFNKQFWVVNTFELFERGAFYTMMGIFVYHFTDNIGISPAVMGTITALLMFMLYFVPLIASALAAKIGYKIIFLFSFIMIMIGYFLFNRSHDVMTLSLGVIAVGIGAGCFKPIVSATIAHVTPEKDRNYGYSIYYWMINLGAFVFPLIAGIYIENVLGDTKLYGIAFLISCGLVAINIVTCLIFFKDPIPADRSKKVLDALKNLSVIAQDKKFAILLVIYSGFWFMYSLNLSFLPVYMVDFGLRPVWFAVAWIGIVNPGTIIVVGPFLGKFVDKLSGKFSSVQLMIGGIALYIAGMLIMTFFKTFLTCVIGIIIFSFGEFITHPNFISYVSKIAPKARVAVYLGYAFIPVGIGNTLGSFASGFLYQIFAVEMHKPTIFWAIVTAVGFLTIGCFLIYNKYVLGSATWGAPASAMAAPTDAVKAAPKPLKLGSGLIMDLKITPLVVIILIPLLIFSAVGMPTDRFYNDQPDEYPHWFFLSPGTLGSQSGTSDENTDQTLTVVINQTNIVNVTVTLTWTDEPAPYPRYVNQPDEFGVRIDGPDGTTAESGMDANPSGSDGTVSATITRDGTNLTGDTASGAYNITIQMGNAGDSKLRNGPGVIVFTDSGNAWSLEITYDFYEEVAASGK